VDLALDTQTSDSLLPLEADEARLLRDCRRGDRQAFERLYRLHVGRVHAVCLRLTADVDTAEELTQEAFIRAWQQLAKFRGASAFATWLHRLTVNVVHDHQRREWPRRRFWGATTQADAIDEAPPARPEWRLDLEAAIRRLPLRARTVFVLHDVEGWQHPEIARLTGTAVGTCKAHLHRARGLLKEWLTL
jgi:RNA polymerase sigma factor (sigma-70 family)